MRKDIEIHINTGDIALISTNKFTLRKFRWVDEPDLLSRYIYGEIDVPYIVSENSIKSKGVYCNIPYTPIYKEIKIRIRRINEDGDYSYIYNEVNNSEWFTVQTALYGKDLQNVFASTLVSISEDSFYLELKGDIARIYSAYQSDFNIIRAGRQNANCLLACFPSNNYRYPLTGVGLARWINSNNVAATSLTQVLQDQFKEDGVTINNASYNYDTQQMELDAKDLNK